MKRILFLTSIVGLLVCCNSKQEPQQIPVGFKMEKILRYTPIKDQGKLPLCWLYAMLSTIETEHLMQGDSINLSVDFVARQMLMHDGENVPLRGVGPMAIELIEKYGVVPYDSYQDKSLSKSKDYLPKKVHMLGAEYTYLEFAHSVCLPDEYQTVMSNNSKPYYEMQDPELDDNRYNCKALNVPQDTLVSLIYKALIGSHPVYWEGGENDNHAVSIIGMGHDKEGTKYFVAKNSWGADNPTHGLMYIKENYLKTHTALIVLSRSINESLLNPKH